MNAPRKSITAVEIVVGLGLIGVLFGMAIPAIHIGPVHSSPSLQILSNMLQLQKIAQIATLDNGSIGKPIRWTCSNNIPLSYSQWTNSITNEAITPLIVKKLLTAYGGHHFLGDNRNIENGIAVYAVTESDPGDTLLLATKNWHGPGSNLSGAPYGNTFFVVVHKAGDGVILKADKAQNTNLVSSGGAYHYLPLK